MLSKLLQDESLHVFAVPESYHTNIVLVELQSGGCGRVRVRQVLRERRHLLLWGASGLHQEHRLPTYLKRGFFF